MTVIAVLTDKGPVTSVDSARTFLPGVKRELFGWNQHSLGGKEALDAIFLNALNVFFATVMRWPNHRRASFAQWRIHVVTLFFRVLSAPCRGTRAGTTLVSLLYVTKLQHFFSALLPSQEQFTVPG